MILIIKSCLKQKEQVKKEIQLEKTIENTIIIYFLTWCYILTPLTIVEKHVFVNLF